MLIYPNCPISSKYMATNRALGNKLLFWKQKHHSLFRLTVSSFMRLTGLTHPHKTVINSFYVRSVTSISIDISVFIDSDRNSNTACRFYYLNAIYSSYLHSPILEITLCLKGLKNKLNYQRWTFLNENKISETVNICNL